MKMAQEQVANTEAAMVRAPTPDQDLHAVKVSWHALFLKKTLFVNIQGKKVAEWSWQDMDRMIQERRLIPGDSRSLADRAFQTLQEETKKKLSDSTDINPLSSTFNQDFSGTQNNSSEQKEESQEGSYVFHFDKP